MEHPNLYAEVSSNHGADPARCLRFVSVAADIGCRGVVFQQTRSRGFGPGAVRGVPEAMWPRVALLAARRGIELGATPFYARAVDVLEPWVDFWRLSSFQIDQREILRAVASTGKPVVLAAGHGNLCEVSAALAALRAARCGTVELLHSVPGLPAPAERSELASISTLRETFGLEVGWSDHSREAQVLQRAVARWGAHRVHVHFDLDGQGSEYVFGHCWLPAELAPVFAGPLETAALSERSPLDGDGRLGLRSARWARRLVS